MIHQRIIRITTILLFALALLLTSRWSEAMRAQTAAVDFARDIQPILQTHCVGCHGAGKAMSQLRLDNKASAARVITPGNSNSSRLLHRVLGEGGEARMPLGAAPLNDEQIATLRRWIEQGALWPDSASNVVSGATSGATSGAGEKKAQHWAFINPARPALPIINNAIKNKDWTRNAIDFFVLDKLTRAGLQPAPEADRAALLRRVSFDLTGLPPALAELDDFLNDKSPNAYEKVVDRLLGSPRFGERMAARWLDAARYADTNGYQVDGVRDAWRWRDWVIEAFNQNKPYDQFVTEQLAGDLLPPKDDPNATLEQKIATAFNRNHHINAEGGVVPEEYRNEYVVDRVDTASTVFMGLTVGCARCHSHKFDPISHREFYQMSAFFNSIDEDGHSFDQGNSPPYIKVVFDGLEQWENRVRIYVNGQEQKLKFNQRNFFLMFAKSKDTLKFGAGGGPAFRFKGALDEVRMYTRGMSADEIEMLACGETPVRIAALPAAERTRAQTMKLQRAFLALAAPPELKEAAARWQTSKQIRQKYEDELPTLMVMREMPTPRPQFLLKQNLPDSVRRGQRLTGMSAHQTSLPIAPPLFKFAQHGQSGAWISELFPHTARVVDDLAFIKSLHTEQINHDPAQTFALTGFQLAGRPSLGAWVAYGLGSENKDLPAFIAMISVNKRGGDQPLYERLWGSGFLPAQYQGVKFHNGADPVLFLSNPKGLTQASRRQFLDDLAELNQQNAARFHDPEIAARTAQYELAYRMESCGKSCWLESS